MSKKWLAFLVAGMMVACFGLAGCGAEKDEPVPDETGVTEEAPAEEAPVEEAPAVESDYAVTFGEATQATDADGNPVFIVELTWTNNSDEAAEFSDNLMVLAYVDGEEIEKANNVEGLDFESSMTEVAPGESMTVKDAWPLTKGTEVTVKVHDWWNDQAVIGSQVYKF